MKPPKPIPRQSKTRTTQNQLYAKLKAKFLEEHERCFSCRLFVVLELRDLHHLRGRTGKLYLDERFWRMACRVCHNAIHNNPKWAIEEGLLAGPGEWSVCPP